MNLVTELLKFNDINLILWLTTIFLVIQIFYIVFFYFRISFHQPKKFDPKEELPISIVIAARSEAHHLVEFLPFIFAQKYSRFEVVVVNDRSWDDTQEILEAYQKKHANLHIVNIQENNHQNYGKKMAIALGIKGAKHEIILVTDADCKPRSDLWLKEVNKAYQEKEGTEIVLGYSPYQRKKGFLNQLIRFDAVMVALQYLSFAKARKSYMGVGRNLSYQKDLFFKVGGFKSHYRLMSGDDDLLVRDIAQKNNVNIMLSLESQVETLPKETWPAWIYQKKRHFTTSPYYKLKHKILLSIWPFSVLLFYVGIITLLVLNKLLWITLILLVVRTLLVILTFTSAGRWLGNKDVLWLYPFYEAVFIILTPFIYLTSKFSKIEKWN